MGLPHPSSFADARMRVSYTFVGLGIAVAINFLANLLRKRAKARNRSRHELTSRC
jgi:hypothetical protein